MAAEQNSGSGVAAVVIETEAPPMREAGLPRRAMWHGLALVLLVAIVGLVGNCQHREPTRTMEQIVLLRSVETWLRVHDVEAVQQQVAPGVRDLTPWLMPTHNGRPAATKPPMSVWLHLLAWADLDPATTSTTTLLARARAVATAAAVVLILATFWMGHSLGGPRLAMLAGLVAASMYFVQYQARLAAYDMHLAAFTSLSVAAALWAYRPMRDAPHVAMQVAGWALAGVTLGLAILTKGPVSFASVLPAVAVMVAMDRRRWRSGVLGGLAAAVVAAAVAGPWYAYLFTAVPGVDAILAEEYAATRDDPDSVFYYALMLIVVAPWNLWLFAGLFHPFVRARGEARRWMLIPWLWFAIVLVIFSLPEAKKYRYLLPVAPALSLMVAHVWHAHARLPRPDPGVGPLRLLHWLALVAVSVVVLLAVPGLAIAERAGWAAPAVTLPTVWTIVTGVALLGLAIGGWIWHRRWRPADAAFVTALWMVALLQWVWQVDAAAPVYETQIRANAERAAAAIEDGPVYYYNPPDRDGKLHNAFLFYVRRVVPAVETLPATEGEGSVYTIVAADPQLDAALADAGWSLVIDVDTKVDATGPQPHRIWRRP